MQYSDMKIHLIIILALLPFFTFSQNWQSTNGPQDRTRAIGVFNYQDFFVISGSCATFTSETGEAYAPLRYDNGTVDYELFKNKIFFTHYGGTEALFYSGEEWTLEHVDYYSGIDCDSDPYYIYRVVDNDGVQRSINGYDWIFINEGLPSYWLETGPDMGGFVYTVLSISSEEDYLFCGTDTGVFRTNKPTIEWEHKSSGLPDTTFTEIACKGDYVFTASHNMIYRSVDAGENWELNHTLIDGNEVNKIEIFNDTVFVLTKTQGLYLSADYGETWTTFNNGLTSLDVTDINLYEGEYYIAGEHGVSKGLDNWERADHGVVCSYNYGMDASANGIISSQGDELYYLGEDSTEWIDISPEMPTWFISDVEKLDDKVIIALETDNIYETPVQLLESYDNGLNWDLIYEFDNGLRINLGESNGKMSANKGNEMFVSNDAGYTWESQTLYPAAEPCSGSTSILFGNDHWFVGRCESGGRIDRSDNNGATWSPANTGLPWGRIKGLWEFNDTLFASNYSGLFYSFDDGTSWHQCGRGMPENVHSMAEWGGNYYATSGNKVYVSQDGGVSFNSFSDGLPAHSFGVIDSAPTLLLVKNDTLYFGSYFYGVYQIDLNVLSTFLSSPDNLEINSPLIYPNPSNSGLVNIHLPKSYDKVKISVYALSGELIFESEFENNPEIQLDLSNFKGLYILRIDTGESIIVDRIVLN
ncbi:MAG: photosystem II stability/assembly factor-like uncharacterized protein [Crocinitomix sp.]|jgi:photosystem II stability/assembly factor-like uncharacterized protein